MSPKHGKAKFRRPASQTPGTTAGQASSAMPNANPARTRPTHSGGAVISYDYIAGDLKLIGTIAGTLFVLLIALSFFL